MIEEKPDLTLEDIRRFPVWHFDPDRDLYSPLTDLDKSVGSIDELHFRALFKTPTGLEFQGSVTGKGDVAIGIYHNGRGYAANKAWPEASVAQLTQLIKDSPDLNISDLTQVLPLKFKTQVDMEPFVDWEGDFDLD